MRILDARKRDTVVIDDDTPVRHAHLKTDPGGFPQRKAAALPFVAASHMRDLQRAAIDDYHVDILQLTENAGRATATLVHAMFGGKARGQRVLVMAGGGSNGAAGLVAVRHLANWGFAAEPVFGEITEEMAPHTRRQAEILRASGLYELQDRDSSATSLREHLRRADLIVDALVGYGLAGPPAGISAAATEMAVECGRPILSLDVPTGVDSTTGTVSTPAVHANTTLLLDLPKRGLLEKSCHGCVGEMYLADLGIPRAVYESAGINVDGIFSEGPIVRIRR